MNVPVHFGRLTEQDIHGQINRLVVKVIVVQLDVLVFSRFSDHRKGAALSGTNGFKAGNFRFRYSQHVALLSFVAPDLQWRHLRLSIGNGPQLKTPTGASVLHQLW